MSNDTKKIVLVTGANSGIGFEIATQLLADASSHVCLGVRSQVKGEAALAELNSRKLAGSAQLLIMDVESEESVAAAANAIRKAHGRLDALVNNAGAASAEGSEAEQMIQLFRVNAVGVHLTGVYFAPLLSKSSGVARIVYITSGAGSVGNRMDPQGIAKTMRVLPYRVSKAAMHMVFASQSKNEYSGDGFKTFLFGPGHTVSNLGPYNKAEFGAKPTSEAAAYIVAILNGEKEADVGQYIEYGVGRFPW